jgi:anhydro-N-acetylmuramic acid kinase
LSEESSFEHDALEPRSRILRYRGREPRFVAGVMSGTSLDGIDVAICTISGTGSTLRQSLVAFESTPYDDAVRRRLLAASAGTLPMREVYELEAELGVAFATAITAAITSAGIASIDAVGLHGQTVYHAPGYAPAGVTVQLAGAATVAARLGSIVVSDFRAADVAADGQGAPLVPYCDLVLLGTRESNRIALNIGGIGNLTWLPREARAESLIAFDTGPGNMLVDAAMRALYGRDYDEAGAVAAQGKVDRDWLREIIDAEPYFAAAWPKSTGRELFGEERGALLVREGASRGLDAPSIVATLTALTASTIAMAARRVAGDAGIDEIVVGGGGVLNRTLMGMLAAELPGTRVMSADDVGLRADAKEAICFAILANEALLETPANVPSVTGARAHVVCGAIHLPPVA